MISIETFTAGLVRLGLAARQPIDEGTFEVYHEALNHETSADEWEAFTLHCVRTDRFTWFPRVVDLREALQGFRGAPPLLPEAVDAYERVMASGEYSPEGGTTWTFRGVLSKCGRAAAYAFLAAGGNSAFATTWNESKRREVFLESYQTAARQDPAARSLPAAEQKAITGDTDDALTPIDAGAAAQAMREIRERLGIQPAARKPAEIVATDERLEVLRRQAAQITTQEPAHAGEEV